MAEMVQNKALGVLARFENSGQLIEAAKLVREAGYKKFDCHSPFPIHGMDKAMGLKRSPLGWLIGLGALIGTSGALTLQWWTSAVDYPLNISGKPLFSYQAFVPITFALGVLFSAIAATIGMLVLNGLPRYHHPVFYSKVFGRVTDDGFFVSIEARDGKFDSKQTAEFLRSIGGLDVEVLHADAD
jgi:hypothetical protein